MLDRGVSGPEIVEPELYAEVLHLVENVRGLLRMFDVTDFGDLDVDLVEIVAASGDELMQPLQHVAFLKLARGEIYIQVYVGIDVLLPDRGVGVRAMHRPGIEAEEV